MKQIIKLFKDNGYQLWQVGGSVRDEVIGIEPNDIDFATDATPDEMIVIYTDFIMLDPWKKNSIDIWHSENGKAHGTIVFQEDKVDYEITTFRKDVSTDGRNAIVEFARTIEEDLSRRDFTINSIAKCAYTGKILDPFNGKEDIKNKVIREAKERIKEDRLRVLRAYRFLSKLGKGWKLVGSFKIDIKELNCLSNERIRDELMKIFKHNPCFALYHMDTNLYYYIFNLTNPHEAPDSHGHYHAESLFYHSMFALAAAVRLTNNPLLGLAVFMHDIGKQKSMELNE